MKYTTLKPCEQACWPIADVIQLLTRTCNFGDQDVLFALYEVSTYKTLHLVFIKVSGVLLIDISISVLYLNLAALVNRSIFRFRPSSHSNYIK